jgi:serine/threonine protein kinase
VDIRSSRSISAHTEVWRRSFGLVEELRSLTDSELAERLEAVHADDPALAASVARMLARNPGDGRSTSSLLQATIPLPRAYEPGNEVGAYTLEKEIGAGGMANVWLAHRTDGTLTRAVAIKLPRSHLSASMLGERFARERNVLGQLDHPHIAKIFDAGTDTRGQPFLALEFIDGKSLDEYCAAHRLFLHARVALIIDAAHALHHAHTRLVLHRDIKPNNILVTNRGTLKLLDFGIAKLLSDDHSAEETEFTRLTGNALTAKYAAPEQLLSETVTTSTDVYALAVVLFELLCGESPFEGDAQTAVGRIKSLRTPARRLSAVAPTQDFLNSCGSISAAKHAREVRGDLTAIIEKALRADTNGRYPSALAFAEDLKNSLSQHPVSARQGAVLYRARRFIQRQKIPIAIAASGVMVALGLGSQTWQAREVAKDSSSRAASIDGLLQGLFSGMSPDEAKSRTFTAKELLDKTTAIIDKSVAEGKYEIPSMRIGEIYRDIGAYDEAIVRFKKERAGAEKRGNKREAFLAHLNEIDVLTRLEKLTDANIEITRAREKIFWEIGASNPLSARLDAVQGQLSFYENKIEKAKVHYQRAESQWRLIQPLNVEQLIWSLEGLAFVARNASNPTLAEEKLLEVIALDEKHRVRGNMDLLGTKSALGTVLMVDARFERARPILNSACNEYFEKVGGMHRDTRATCRNTAYNLVRLGESDKAINILDRLYALTSESDHSERTQIGFLRAFIALCTGRPQSAEYGIKAMLAHLERQANGKSTGTILRTRRLLADSWLRMGQHQKAVRLLLEIEAEQVALLGYSHADTSLTTMLRVLAQLDDDNKFKSKEELAAVAADLTRTRGIHHPVTLAAQSYVALLSIDASIEQKLELANRIRQELRWQTGAIELADLLTRTTVTKSIGRIPIVY